MIAESTSLPTFCAGPLTVASVNGTLASAATGARGSAGPGIKTGEFEGESHLRTPRRRVTALTHSVYSMMPLAGITMVSFPDDTATAPPK